MDFLKIRNRAKAQKDAARTETSPTPTPTPDAVAPAMSSTPPRAQTPPPMTTTPMAEAPPRPAPARTGDPLQAFLARFDDEAVSETVPVSVADDGYRDERRFLTFDLGAERYAANIMDVREILKVVSLTEVPRTPPELLGVSSKRGTVMPVVDLAALVGLRAAERRAQREHRILVAGDGANVCGLRVDRVHQVVRLASSALEDVPASLGARNTHMLQGLGRTRVDGEESPQMLILLDVGAVLEHIASLMHTQLVPAGHGGRRGLER